MIFVITRLYIETSFFKNTTNELIREMPSLIFSHPFSHLGKSVGMIRSQYASVVNCRYAEKL